MLTKSFVSQDSCVFHLRRDQLGSRLDGFLNAWRFARATNRKTILFWPGRKDKENYDSRLLFDVEYLSRPDVAPDLRIIDIAFHATPDLGAAGDLSASVGWPRKLDLQEHLSSLPANIEIVNCSSHYIGFKGESKVQAQTELKQLFNLVLPSSEIREAVKRATEWIGAADYTAIHIRRGDIVNTLHDIFSNFPPETLPENVDQVLLETFGGVTRLSTWIKHFVQRVAPLSSYIELAKAETLPIIIFGDMPSVSFAVQSDLKEAHVMASFATSLSSAQRAYMELLLLTKADKVISTASSYSNVACKYGRPTFIEARAVTGGIGTREVFGELFGQFLAKSEPLREKAYGLLEKHIQSDKFLKTG